MSAHQHEVSQSTGKRIQSKRVNEREREKERARAKNSREQDPKGKKNQHKKLRRELTHSWTDFRTILNFLRCVRTMFSSSWTSKLKHIFVYKYKNKEKNEKKEEKKNGKHTRTYNTQIRTQADTLLCTQHSAFGNNKNKNTFAGYHIVYGESEKERMNERTKERASEREKPSQNGIIITDH